MKASILFLVSLFLGSSICLAQQNLRMATTTSTENSGLLAVLNPPFEQQSGVRLDVIAVGTGKALRLGQNGDVDLVLVHAPKAEQAFVDAGYGVDRQAVMHNDFVIIGPSDDPAQLKSASSVIDALRKIQAARHSFISRGDDSGTHKKEMRLWAMADIEPQGSWYYSIGQGMGKALVMADEKQAYVLTDRGTYLAFQGKIDLVILYENEPPLHNPYHVIAVNPQRHPSVKYDLARQYIAYLISPQAQGLIAEFKKKGQVLFYPDVINTGDSRSDKDPEIHPSIP